MSKAEFEWDENKDLKNQQKHGVSFYEAQHAFLDKDRIIAKDLLHSQEEERYFCFGMDKEKNGILTVRFTYRNESIRIFGAGYWRKDKKIYEQTNPI